VTRSPDRPAHNSVTTATYAYLTRLPLKFAYLVFKIFAQLRRKLPVPVDARSKA